MTRDELYGFEFDWFALDKNNNIALISSAGYGDIPDTVIQNYEDYKNLSKLFLTPHYGTIQIWDDYANYGLFVYDWKIYNGPYEKMRDPHQKMPEEIKKRILNIPNMTKLSVNFHKTKAIEPIQWLKS